MGLAANEDATKLPQHQIQLQIQLQQRNGNSSNSGGSHSAPPSSSPIIAAVAAAAVGKPKNHDRLNPGGKPIEDNTSKRGRKASNKM
jgi:hypothetical protein